VQPIRADSSLSISALISATAFFRKGMATMYAIAHQSSNAALEVSSLRRTSSRCRILVTNSEQTGTARAEQGTRCYWYLTDPARSCLPPVVFSCRIVEQKRFLTRDATVLHSDLFPEFPCDSELVSVEALSTEKVRLFWCSGCGTEFTLTNCQWVMVVYPGMKLDLKV
jgi:hypothetical protein